MKEIAMGAMKDLWGEVYENALDDGLSETDAEALANSKARVLMEKLIDRYEFLADLDR